MKLCVFTAHAYVVHSVTGVELVTVKAQGTATTDAPLSERPPVHPLVRPLPSAA